jgi:hypothetical protein
VIRRLSPEVWQKYRCVAWYVMSKQRIQKKVDACQKLAILATFLEIVSVHNAESQILESNRARSRMVSCASSEHCSVLFDRSVVM